MPVSPARAAAFEILLRIETTDAYASELLHSPRYAKLSPADHGLLTEVVMGVLRWRNVLDDRIAEFSSQPLAKLDAEVLTPLRMGAYQVLFLDRVPKHAAVNESVELVKQARKRSGAGMVNAVLRKIAGPNLSQDREEVARPSDQPSHPRWLVDRWERTYGPEVASKICQYNQMPPQTAVCVTNSGPTPIPRFSRSVAQGVQFEPGNLLAHAAIVTGGDISRSAVLREHGMVIQDEGSQLVALLVGQGKAILDCCAAPGGKTRIIAQRNPNATIVAMDVHPRRAALFRRLVSDSNVHVMAADARRIPLAKTFDRILVDVPCTGTGTLARNPEIKWRLTPGDVLRLQAYQIEILTAAMKHMADDGRIVYSTCSLEPEENEAVIGRVLAAESSFRIFDCSEPLRVLARDGELVWEDVESLLSGPYLRMIPGVHPCDGFFTAVLEKK